MPLALLICATLAVCVLPFVSALAKQLRSASVKREFQLTPRVWRQGAQAARAPVT
jgi:hypothetical protein